MHRSEYQSIVAHAKSGMDLYDPAFETVSFTKYTSLTNCLHNSQYELTIDGKEYSNVEDYMSTIPEKEDVSEKDESEKEEAYAQISHIEPSSENNEINDKSYHLARALVHKFTQNEHCFRVLMSTGWGRILQDRKSNMNTHLLMAVRNALHSREELYIKFNKINL